MQLGLQEAKQAFFDTEAVMNAMDRSVQRSLSRVGAFLRTRMRSSIRKRKQVSQPGAPPSDHGGALKRLLFFAYDSRVRSVVVGPVLFSGGKSSGQEPPAPEALEYGGVVQVRIRKDRTATFRYRPRPFAQPALEAEVDAGTIDNAFKDSLTRLVGG
jgi:hypothetical protein